METAAKKKSSRSLVLGGAFVLLVVIGGVFYLILKQNRSVAADRNERESLQKKGLLVKEAKVEVKSGVKNITLIGEVRPFLSVTLYAKISGYLDKVLVDKGDYVKSGQLLASIISPEIDQAYQSALADLENKKRILSRDESLLQKQFISTQDKEQSETAVTMAKAQLKSIEEQQEYKFLRAPFDGTVTARYADPGALMQNATSGSSGALPVVTISQLNKVRIYVYVEQKDAAYLKDNYPVTISFFERPDVKIAASVTRIAGELDPRTRMMLTEIDLSNADHVVIPGSFVQVIIESPSAPLLQIPREALVIQSGKYFVTRIMEDNTIHFQPIKIGDNTGDQIVVLNGLSEGQRVALNVGNKVEEGQKIRTKP
jgi:membrane fusion protein, multidrug efflux system